MTRTATFPAPLVITERSGITRTVRMLPIGAVVNRPPRKDDEPEAKEMAKPSNKAAPRPSTK